MTRRPVSDAMWNHERLVVALRDQLGSRLINTTGTVPSGYLKADTDGPNGFSLRVNRRDGSGPDTSLFAIKDGAWFLFPTRCKLRCCLPGHDMAVRAYLSLVTGIEWQEGHLDVEGRGYIARPWIGFNEPNREALLVMMDQFAQCVQALADAPPSHR